MAALTNSSIWHSSTSCIMLINDLVLINAYTGVYQRLSNLLMNGEKPFSNNIFGKKLSEKNIIECKQGRVGGGKREWQYILDRSKIIAKLRESGLGDMEEFSDTPIEDTPQPVLPEN